MRKLKELRISNPQAMEKIARYFGTTFSEDDLEHNTVVIEETEEAIVMYIHEYDSKVWHFNHAKDIEEAIVELILFEE